MTTVVLVDNFVIFFVALFFLTINYSNGIVVISDTNLVLIVAFYFLFSVYFCFYNFHDKLLSLFPFPTLASVRH